MLDGRKGIALLVTTPPPRVRNVNFFVHRYTEPLVLWSDIYVRHFYRIFDGRVLFQGL